MDQQVRRNPGADALGVRRVPDRGDVQRLTGDLRRRAHGRVEPLEQPTHQHRAPALRRVDDLLDMGEGVGDRLLDQQRQPGLDDRHRVGMMELRRGGDHHGVDAGDLRLGQPLRGESIGDPLAGDLVGIGDPGQLRGVGAGQHAGVQRSHRAGSDEPDPQRHQRSPSRLVMVVTMRSRSLSDRCGCTGNDRQRRATSVATGTSATTTCGCSR